MARFDKFTLKAQEAVQAAQDIASKAHNQQIEVEHLLLALVEQADGVVLPLLEEARRGPGQAARRSAGRRSTGFPKVEGLVQTYLAPAARQAVRAGGGGSAAAQG